MKICCFSLTQNLNSIVSILESSLTNTVFIWVVVGLLLPPPSLLHQHTDTFSSTDSLIPHIFISTSFCHICNLYQAFPPTSSSLLCCSEQLSLCSRVIPAHLPRHHRHPAILRPSLITCLKPITGIFIQCDALLFSLHHCGGQTPA